MKAKNHKIMRNLIVCLFTVLLFANCSVLLFANCSKGNNSNEEESGITSNNFITAKVDGEDFTINDYVFVSLQEDEDSEYNLIIVSNSEEAEFGFGLSFPNSEGTFETKGETTSLSFLKKVVNTDDPLDFISSAWVANHEISQLIILKRTSY